MRFQTLIVEDNPEFRNALHELLAAYFPDMEISEAASGSETLDSTRSCMHQLVFMDIKLPDANGLELTRQIKSHCAGTVVIVLTSHDVPEYRTAALNAGASYFLTKNASSGSEILSLVGSLLHH